MQAELNSPIISWTGTVKNMRRFYALLVAWMAFWIAVTIGLSYVYVVMLPQWVGFQTTVLIGIVLLILASSGD